MGTIDEDLKKLAGGVRRIHDDVDHLEMDLDTLADDADIDPDQIPALAELRDHVNDLDDRVREMLRRYGSREDGKPVRRASL
ncbi:hypothetical protein JCM14469_25100 [Desulfatiferula olefinivorans]